jgi:flagellar biogenesis protein FliO
MDMVWRLTWALPFTVLIGGAIILLLKHILGQAKSVGRTLQRMVKRESLTISDDTRIHLVEVDGRPYVLVESTRTAALHNAPPILQPAGLRGGWSVPSLRGLRSGVSQ